ncbi:hypothetical protein DASC09_060870 [Saccharomycopsis crataegensis]|uniref:Mediator of RNA polymerase II transcription subunit 1 n=1 Tax=Saccharomycopsis crataegensis TaxID=43959 RepID=A0AAV5QUZ4_9ASCO|nr:hypothetical protein DASC09_060870 [Saccharomycopsis crataegensis]
MADNNRESTSGNGHSKVDPLLSYQLTQSINHLMQRPGQVTKPTIKRIAEFYGFDTFNEITENDQGIKVDRLTIAGSILLIDIDFLKQQQKQKTLQDNDGDVIINDSTDAEIGKEIVDAVSLSLASKQKIKELLNNIKDHNNTKAQMHRLMIQLKNLYSLTYSGSCAPSSCNNVLYNCLKSPETKDLDHEQVQYNVVKLNTFSDNLKYLAILDKLSVYSASEVSLQNDRIFNSDGNSSGNVVLFEYLDDLAFILSFLFSYESKILISDLQKSSSTSFNGMLDILNGYSKFGKTIINLNDKELGIFIKYWEDNRLLKYKKLQDAFVKQYKDGDGDNGMMSDDKEFEKIIQFYETNFENDNKICNKGTKYIKIGIDYHFKNGLPQLQNLIRNETFKKIAETAAQSNFSNDAWVTKSTILSNLNFISSLKIPYSSLLSSENPECQACLNLKFSKGIWVPTDLLGSYFGNFITYDSDNGNTGEFFENFKGEDKEKDGFSGDISDQEDDAGGDISDQARFRSKKRNEVNELYIKNYNDLFANSHNLKNKKPKIIKPSLNDVLKNFNEEHKKNYLLKFEQKKNNEKQGDPASSKKPIEVKLQINYKLISKLKKVSSLNLYNDCVDKSDDIPIDNEGNEESLKDQLLQYIKDSSKSRGNVNMMKDEEGLGIGNVSSIGPLLTSNKGIFFKTHPSSGKTTMNIVSELITTNSKNKVDNNIDMLVSLGLFLESLRSLSLVWNLVKSLSKKSIVLTKQHEDYITSKLRGLNISRRSNFREFINDTTPEVISNTNGNRFRRASGRASISLNEDVRRSLSFGENSTIPGDERNGASGEGINLDKFIASINEEAKDGANGSSLVHRFGSKHLKTDFVCPVPFLNVSIYSLSKNSSISQKIYQTCGLMDNISGRFSDIYELQISTNLPLFNNLLKGHEPVSENNDMIAEKSSNNDIKMLKIMIYNGRVENIQLLVQDKLCVSSIDQEPNPDANNSAKPSQNHKLIGKLKELTKFINYTEDLYLLFSVLLR